MICRSCVSRVDDVAVVTPYDITDRLDIMIHPLRSHAYPVGQGIEFSLRQRLKLKKIAVLLRNGSEIRAYDPIDKALLERVQDSPCAVYF